MKREENPRIDKIFKAIADPTRRSIFHALVLAGSALSITQISAEHDISRQGVTKHIKNLESAGLITINKDGRERYCIAEPKTLQLVFNWLSYYDKFWDDTLDRLDDHLNNSK